MGVGLCINSRTLACRVGVLGGGHGNRSVLGLRGELDELLEHQFASVLRKFVDIVGSEVLGRDGVEDYGTLD